MAFKQKQKHVLNLDMFFESTPISYELPLFPPPQQPHNTIFCKWCFVDLALCLLGAPLGTKVNGNTENIIKRL